MATVKEALDIIKTLSPDEYETLRVLLMTSSPKADLEKEQVSIPGQSTAMAILSPGTTGSILRRVR